MFEKLMNIIYPKTCPICEKIIEHKQMLCEKCRETLAIIHKPYCIKCGQQLFSEEEIYCKDCKEYIHFFNEGVAVFDFQGKICQSIYRFKYENAREYALFYGTMAVNLYGHLIKKWGIEKIIPIPIYRKKKIIRGYNQSLEFAKIISKQMNIPIDEKALVREKDTIPQKGITRQARYQNLKDAFFVCKESCENLKNILLVDDIYTTGSTMDACAGLLKATGVKNVYFLCIANGRGNE